MRNRARRADAGKRRTEILLLLSYCTAAMSFNPGNFGFGFLRINTLSYARNTGAICNRIRCANTMRNRARRIKNFPARRPHFAARFGEDKICPFARAQCQIRNIKKFAPAKFAASQGSPLRKTFSPARKYLITPVLRSAAIPQQPQKSIFRTTCRKQALNSKKSTLKTSALFHQKRCAQSANRQTRQTRQTR